MTARQDVNFVAQERHFHTASSTSLILEGETFNRYNIIGHIYLHSVFMILVNSHQSLYICSFIVTTCLLSKFGNMVQCKTMFFDSKSVEYLMRSNRWFHKIYVCPPEFHQCKDFSLFCVQSLFCLSALGVVLESSLNHYTGLRGR